MRILFANKFYYRRGGADIYNLELEKLLKKNGHEVASFAMQHPENIESEYEKFFPTEIDFIKKDFKDFTKAVLRPIYSNEVKSKFTKLIKEFNPEIVHFSNIHSQLSPIIAQIAYKNNIPVVWTTHDFKLLCPRYDCMRNHQPCELCFENKWNVIKHKCLKGSLPASIIAFLEAVKWNKKKMQKYTSVFISPSKFLMNKLTNGHFDKQKVVNLYNFIDISKTEIEIGDKEEYYCYVGRLSKEKGVETLLKAAKSQPYNLKVIGGGPLADDFKAKYNVENIDFLGHRTWEEIKQLVNKARFLVLPSECYENNPLSVIEALCLGTPVLGAKMGGIPELIEEGINGKLFKSGDVDNLSEKIAEIYSVSDSFDYANISKEAKMKFSSKSYYEKLLKIYTSLINGESL